MVFRQYLAGAIVIALAVCSTSAQRMNITSPIVTNWGYWGAMEWCPYGRFAQGFQLRTESNQYLGDDTALNTIRIFCGEPSRGDTAVITSTPGQFGDWGNVYTCRNGYLNGFQLRSEKDRGIGDDTAANNIRFFCSSLPNPNDYIEGDGMAWGEWTASQHCRTNQRICSIQTQVEPYQGSGDDTMLNNVRFECCDPFLNTDKPEVESNKKYTTVDDLNIWGHISPKFLASAIVTKVEKN